MTRLLPAIILFAGCSPHGGDVYQRYDALRPHTTTWESFRASNGEAASANTPHASAQPLSALVGKALQSHPSVAMARAQWLAAIEAIGPAGLPPRPMVSYTWLPLPVETRVGPNEHRVGVNQAVPSPFVLAADVDIARAAADRARANLDRTALRLVATIKQRAAEVRYHERALQSLRKSEAIATQLVALAGERVTAEKGALYDVTKARTELVQLHYDRVRFEELLRLARARLNAALDRPVRSTLPRIGEIPVSATPSDVEGLYKRAVIADPGVGAADASIEAREAGVARARGRLFPDFTFGAQLMINGPATAGNPPDSGEEALGITIGMSLPIWFWADASAIRSAEARLEAEVHNKRAYITDLLVDIEDAWLRHAAATRLVDLYDSTLLPQATSALADADAWRRVGSVGFTEFLEARATLYRFELARERAQADAVIAEAALERLIGGPL